MSARGVARGLGRGLALVAIVVSWSVVAGTSAHSDTTSARLVDAPLETLRARAVRLGTLGGGYSEAAAVDGSVVVGWSTIRGDQSEHAFAYDLSAPTPVMQDLGTLGGSDSWANAVSGQIVVGTSRTSNGVLHAFAYDLSHPETGMRDLGTLPGGRLSWAEAVDGDIVVGTSDISEGRQAAFAYDLGAAVPVMQNLGTLGLRSQATAVDGSVVVGTFDRGGKRVCAFTYDLAAAPDPTMRDLGILPPTRAIASVHVDGHLVAGGPAPDSGEPSGHAFLVDLTAAPPSMRDLGTLGGDFSTATGVDGRVVVGEAEQLDGTHRAFAYDLDDASPAMRNLGTLGGDYSSATGVDGHIVVGESLGVGSLEEAFAYDLDADTPRMVDLPTPSRAEVYVAGVDGEVVAGTVTGGRVRARAWVLSRTTAPAFHFTRFTTAVQENGRTATLTVTRAGDPTPAVSVHYATRRDPYLPGRYAAIAGRDYSATSGILSFASGETEKSFTIPIRNDSRSEGPETLLIGLSAPTGQAILGTPRTAQVIIRRSDQRPDAWIRAKPDRRYKGNNVYNRTGNRQTRHRTARRTQTRIFYARITNDGTRGNTFILRASRPRAGSRVRYTRRGVDVTGALQSPDGLRMRIRDHGDYRLLTIHIKVRKSAVLGSWKPATLTATWTGDGTRTDRVKAAVHVTQ